MRVLIVEDEGAIRHALSRGLQRAGHIVAVGGSVAEARACAAEARPDVLVTDLKLPDGNGLDVASELGVPFVAMSGYANFDDAVRALQLGCVDFFTKPVAIQAVRKRLEQVDVQREREQWSVIAGEGTVDRIGPASAGWNRESISLWQAAWADDAEARACYDRYVHASDHDDGTTVDVLAELLQVAPTGSLTVNRGSAWWAACLDAEVDWSAPEHSDRRRVIEHLTDRCILRREGALVEVCHG